MANAAYAKAEHNFMKMRLGNRYPKIISKFKNATDDDERVAIAYKVLASFKDFDEEPMEPYNKTNEQADAYRQRGNEAFKDPQRLQEALALYKSAILVAKYPTSDADNWSSIALAFGNRSAVLFKMSKYDECLSDIEQAIKLRYPDRLKYKLFARQGDVLQIMGKVDEAKKSYEDAKKSLDFGSELTAKEKREFQLRIGRELTRMAKGQRRPEKYRPLVVRPVPHVADGANAVVPAASSCMELVDTPEWGRHFIATRDIQSGEVLMVEEPFFTLLRKDNNVDYCCYCLEKSDAMIPCKTCFTVLYCSETCRDEAMLKYHDMECSGRWQFINYTEYNLCARHMRALIVAAKRHGGLRGLRDYVRQLDESSRDGRIAGINTDGKHDSSDYASVRHVHHKEHEGYLLEEAFSLATNAAFFLHHIVFHDAVKLEMADKGLRRFVGGLLLSLQRTVGQAAVEIGRETTEEGPTSVGYGIYPTVNLLNHSCDANAFQYVHGTTVVVVAYVPIAKGEQIFYDYSNNVVFSPKMSTNRLYCIEPPPPSLRSSIQQMYDMTCTCRYCIGGTSDWASQRSWVCRSCSAYFPQDVSAARGQVACPRCNSRSRVDQLQKDVDSAVVDRMILMAKALSSVNITPGLCRKLTELSQDPNAPLCVIHDFKFLLRSNVSQMGKYLYEVICCSDK